jgi:molecular chaperone DnaK
MSQDNKTIGRFELSDIPPAQRGVPQIEVTFDLDANGILAVSAKDLGTGKEQSINITASSGLTQDEIDRMTQDAELHAEEDKRRKELVETKNSADALVHSTEKSLKDLGDKVDEETKANVQTEIDNVNKVKDGDDVDAIKTAVEALTQASHKLAELMYAQASQETHEGPAGGPEAGAKPKKDDDDVVDADFEEVK